MKDREERKRFKLNGRFQNWKQIPEVLPKDQGFYYMHEGCILQTGFQRFLMCPFIKRYGRAFTSKTRGWAFKILNKGFETLGQALKALSQLLKV